MGNVNVYYVSIYVPMYIDVNRYNIPRSRDFLENTNLMMSLEVTLKKFMDQEY